MNGRSRWENKTHFLSPSRARERDLTPLSLVRENSVSIPSLSASSSLGKKSAAAALSLSAYFPLLFGPRRFPLLGGSFREFRLLLVGQLARLPSNNYCNDGTPAAPVTKFYYVSSFLSARARREWEREREREREREGEGGEGRGRLCSVPGL